MSLIVDNQHSFVYDHYDLYAMAQAFDNVPIKRPVRRAFLWSCVESAVSMFCHGRMLFDGDALFPMLPSNINDAYQWFQFQQKLVQVMRAQELTMYIKALRTTMRRIDSPTPLMYFVLATLLVFRYVCSVFSPLSVSQ